jgi:hypothetical protein
MEAVDRTRLASLALTVCLLASCSAQPAREETAAPRRTAGTATSSPGTASPPPADEKPTAEGLPTVAAAHDPAALAHQLDLAVATLRDPDATDVDVRRAGELQQLSVHALAEAPPSFRTRALASLRPGTATITRSDVRAALELRRLGTPQPRLPLWRIVAPPPVPDLLRLYRAAQRRTGVHWTYLAAIHLVETRMGRIRGLSTAGARGPMQFLPPTWDLYGAGGDIDDPGDAILAAGRLLRSNGAPADMREALWHYNPSDHYVRAVTEHARTLQQAAWAYRGYWSWRVLYRHVRGTYLLPVGYPKQRPVLLR